MKKNLPWGATVHGNFYDDLPGLTNRFDKMSDYNLKIKKNKYIK